MPDLQHPSQPDEQQPSQPAGQKVGAEVEKTVEHAQQAAQTVFQTAQTKKGRIGYIAIYAAGVITGLALMHLWIKG